MQVYRRPIRFEDVDAAHIVFFARFFHYAHEATESFFSGIHGGYDGLIMKRALGFPVVKVEASYHAPLRYGDALDIETRTVRLGNRSATLGFRLIRVADRALSAEIAHSVVMTDLRLMASCDMPDDVRAVLASHLDL
jgi:4-hydroxybenzoyl-CoA thioesterase